MTTPCIDVLFIQGASDGAHEADRALADALGSDLGAGFRVHFPRMPHEEAPDNDVWREAISTALHDTQAALLVAHSAGAAIVAFADVQVAAAISGPRCARAAAGLADLGGRGSSGLSLRRLEHLSPA